MGNLRTAAGRWHRADVSGAGRERILAGALVAGAILAAVLIRISILYEPYTFLIGDCPYYTQAAISILGDLDLDLRNQLRGGFEPHARQIALGARGEWYPKHPILMPLLTAPLLPILGMDAFLVFNVGVLVALGLALYKLCSLSARRPAAVLGALATVLGSFLILYDYNYSPDLFACLFLTLAVIGVIRERPVAAGFLGGVAVLARTSNLFLLPILGLYVAWTTAGRLPIRAGKLAAFLSAAAIPLLAQGALNAAMFGSPAVSPYMRIIDVENGQPILRTHMSDFDNPLWDGLSGQLFDRRRGLLFTAPILLAALPGFFLWWKKRPEQAILCLAVGEFLLLLFSRYRWWPTSHEGNRFLMPTVALAAPAVACLIEWAIGRTAALGSPSDGVPETESHS